MKSIFLILSLFSFSALANDFHAFIDMTVEKRAQIIVEANDLIIAKASMRFRLAAKVYKNNVTAMKEDINNQALNMVYTCDAMSETPIACVDEELETLIINPKELRSEINRVLLEESDEELKTRYKQLLDDEKAIEEAQRNYQEIQQKSAEDQASLRRN